MSKKIKIKRFDKNLPLPEYKTAGAAGFDLTARETTVIKPDALSQGVLALEVMHPHDLAAILGELVQLGYASNGQVETTLNRFKSMDPARSLNWPIPSIP